MNTVLISKSSPLLITTMYLRERSPRRSNRSKSLTGRADLMIMVLSIRFKRYEYILTLIL